MGARRLTQLAREQSHWGAKGQSPGNFRKADEARTGWMRQELRMERPGLVGSLRSDGSKGRIFLQLPLPDSHLRVMEESGGKLNRRYVDSGLLN